MAAITNNKNTDSDTSPYTNYTETAYPNISSDSNTAQKGTDTDEKTSTVFTNTVSTTQTVSSAQRTSLSQITSPSQTYYERAPIIRGLLTNTDEKTSTVFTNTVSTTQTVSSAQRTSLSQITSPSQTYYESEPTIGDLLYGTFKNQMQNNGFQDPFNSPEDSTLLISIFNTFGNSPFDTLPLFLISSINLDFMDLLKNEQTLDVIMKGYPKSFNKLIFSFVEDVATQTQHLIFSFREDMQAFSQSKETSIQGKYIDQITKRIELLKNKLEKEKHPLIRKHQLFMKLLTSPDWQQISCLAFAKETGERYAKSEKQRSQTVLNQQKIKQDPKQKNKVSAAPDTSYVPFNNDEPEQYIKKNLSLQGHALSTLRLSYIRALKDYYEQSKTTYLAPPGSIHPKDFLKKIEESLTLWKDADINNRQKIIENIIQEIKEQEAHFKSHDLLLTEKRRLPMLQAIQGGPNTIHTFCQQIASLQFYIDFLHLLASDFSDFFSEKNLFYTAHRAHQNIQSLISLNSNKFSKDLVPAFDPFLEVVKKGKFYSAIELFLNDNPVFEDGATATLMDLWIGNVNLPEPKSWIPALEKFRNKALARAEELLKARKQDEAEKLAAEYTEACYKTLMPLFLIIHDLRKINNDESLDQHSLEIPAEIFDFVCLELNIPKIESVISDESPEELEPAPVVEPAPQQAPSKIKQKKVIQAKKAAQEVPEPDDFRQYRPGRNETMTKWAQRIQKEFGLVLVSGGRHMHLTTKAKTLVATLPLGHGGKQTAPVGTASSLQKQLEANLLKKKK